MQSLVRTRNFLILFIYTILNFAYANSTKAHPITLSTQSEYVEYMYIKNTGYTLRIFHDGYWWIQLYDDDDKLINEYIDPDQT